MPFIYKTRVDGRPSKNNKFIHFDIHILRSDDGEGFEEVALFYRKYLADRDDSVLIEYIWSLVEKFIRTDADQIAKGDLAERIEAIADGLEGRSIQINAA